MHASKVDTTTMLTPLTAGGTSTKLEQHSKPILSPTRSLDEGFESDPDRVSTDSEHQTSGTSCSSSSNSNNNNNNSQNNSSQINSNGNDNNNTNNNNNNNNKNSNRGVVVAKQGVGSTLAQLSSAATGGLTASTATASAMTATTSTAGSSSICTTAATKANMKTDLHKQRLLTMVAPPPQITRRQPAISVASAVASVNNTNGSSIAADMRQASDTAMDKFHKELDLQQQRRGSAESAYNNNYLVTSNGNGNNNSNNKHHLGTQYRASSNLAALTANVARASNALTTPTSSAGASPLPAQRLQYQKQRQPMVASAAGHQTVHNHRFTAGGSAVGGGVASGFRRARTRAMSPAVIKGLPTASHNSSNNVGGGVGGMQVHASRTLLLPRSANVRSHSVDAISRHRHGYDPANALILKHEGSGITSTGVQNAHSVGGPHGVPNNVATNTRMMNYKYPSGGVGAGSTAAGQALLVQPISSVTLSASTASASLPAATTVLSPANVGDAAAALVAAAGGSPVIASATNSLYTFYPAEGNLQVWQSECGDLTYKSSRNQHTHKAPVCWTQSIPRQTRR
ncbi:homeobox protein 5-like [Anastrepha ludens]|uniref:homeobox protein 5-like n=1 Tax=Anastrepha ludens TaxID=28586 RepID=UPI0023B0578F|nr:homeobox protein 5-like [Anastrepha ludens]XP_053959504.1 homeobox protein 5-like [Anastrepha ludens]